MNAYTRDRSGRSRWRRATGVASVAALVAVLLPLAACSTSDLLTVEDPDIINPSDVQSPAGAEAVRVGALARLNTATSGGESLFLLGGLFADEWNNGDSYIARQEVDQRVITPQNNFLTDADRALHRARLSGEQAVQLLRKYNPEAPGWEVAEMYFVQAYIENLAAENYCNGVVFSTVVDGREEYGKPITVVAAFERALAHADSGLAAIAGATANDTRVRNALRVTRGRILMNLDRHADAAAAVAGVPTSFRYEMLHSATTNSNEMWEFNNLARRYSVSTNEGGNGVDFATAKDPRLPVCQGGDAACRAVGVTQSTRDDLSKPMYVQLLWPAKESPVAIVDGVEARMIEAEAQLRAGDAAGALATLNAARATASGLTPLADAGSTAARVDQLFRERAFWFFGRGHRVGDLRRLVRQYGRAANTVFPTGGWHKGGDYGTDVTIPVPQAEENNPNVTPGQTCLDRNA
ncbi:MAG TPA: RagB/SusD family nutrient uptake outer membrane protein [Longimicrobiales bacterium]|nr:RagB/SusD family nutrient uptake outer membrane protein [Longimicrobiales bacterium]